MSVFDENGIEIQSSDTQCYNNITNKYVSTSFGIYNNIAGGPYAFIVKFWLENLHPPVLSLISYFMANSIEPEAGHRAIFILPSSFIGMMGRTEEGNPVARFLTAVLLISPSIILSLILALRIKKNAIVLGLTKNEITFWMVATIAFGLVGYITYRLVNPKNSLVTCLNCGKSRRSDFEKCHRCNSSWHVPELTPPSWRVFDY